jgi:hypothetical protein
VFGTSPTIIAGLREEASRNTWIRVPTNPVVVAQHFSHAGIERGRDYDACSET